MTVVWADLKSTEPEEEATTEPQAVASAEDERDLLDILGPVIGAALITGALLKLAQIFLYYYALQRPW